MFCGGNVIMSMEIIIFVVAFVAFSVGNLFGQAKIHKDFANMLKAAEVKITLSKYQGMIYAHDELTGSFLTQASSMDELSKKLQALDGTKTFIAKASELQAIKDNDSVKVS